MGYESRTHVNVEELSPLEQRIAHLEHLIAFVNDKIDFVLQVSTASVMPEGSELALEPPKPVQIPLAELYIKVRKEGLGLRRHAPAPAIVKP